MEAVNVHQAKSQLSRLLKVAEAGEEVVIERRNAGGSVSRFALVPVAAPDRSALFGALKGEFRMPSAEEWAESDREIAAMFEESIAQPLDPTR
jgi:antitoxin (DNA-binding transcriptional repressor) of toxin-antitoxin stability system